jgi:hypothetical protein
MCDNLKLCRQTDLINVKRLENFIKNESILFWDTQFSGQFDYVVLKVLMTIIRNVVSREKRIHFSAKFSKYSNVCQLHKPEKFQMKVSCLNRSLRSRFSWETQQNTRNQVLTSPIWISLIFFESKPSVRLTNLKLLHFS